MCTTTTHWATHYSNECSLGGNAQCDGYCDDHGKECTCPCHNDWDLPQTVEEVLVWHDQMHDVVDSYEGFTIGERWTEAGLAADRLNAAETDGSVCVVREGQDRTVVVRTWK